MDVEYMRSCSNLIEIQWWDIWDEAFHSYLVEGGMLMDELIGRICDVLEEIPEEAVGAKVFVTSGDLNRLMELENQIEDYIVRDVEFVTPMEILNGKLRGRWGVLMITDTWFMTDEMRHVLYQEAEVLKCTLGRYTVASYT